MAEEVNKKDHKYYDIDEETYKENLKNEYEQFTKETVDMIDEVLGYFEPIQQK